MGSVTKGYLRLSKDEAVVIAQGVLAVLKMR